MTVIEFKMCCCVPNFIKIVWFFDEIWRFKELQYRGRPASILNFRNLQFMSRYRYCQAIPCFPFQNFTEMAAELWPKSDF